MEEIKKHILNIIPTLKQGRSMIYSNSEAYNFYINSKDNTLNYANILLRKIIEQYVSLTYDGKPDYEIKSTIQNNSDINNLFDSNYNNIDKNIKQAIEEYFIYGYACIIIDDLSGELINVSPNKVYVSKEDNNILVIEDVIDIEKRALLSQKYKKDIEDSLIKYVYYSSEGINYKFIYLPKEHDLLLLGKSVNSKNNCYLESSEYSELAKISPYLNIYENLSKNYANSLEHLKLIALCEPGIENDLTKILKNQNVLITLGNSRVADLPLNQQLQWLDNSSLAKIVDLFNIQLNEIKAKIYEILGFNDVYGNEDVKQTEETRISSAHRVSRELALWKYKQHRILLYVEKVLSAWLSFMNKSLVIVSLGSTNLLEKERKEQAKENAISNLLTLCTQVMQVQEPALLAVYKEAGNLIIKDASLDVGFSNSFNSFIETLQNHSNENNPNADIEMQGVQLELARGQAEIDLKQAQAQKAAADANNAAIEAELRPITLQNEIKRVEQNKQQTNISAAREERIERQQGIINKIKNFFRRGK